MIALQLYLTYIAAVFVISGTPGPNMLLAMTHGIRYGARHALPTMIGAMLGVVVILCVSLSGLGALLKTSADLFMVVKWLGAAYLNYLGIKMWLEKVSDSVENADNTTTTTSISTAIPSAFQRFSTGFSMALSNPKAILFGLAFFPQFINQNTALLPQAALLLGTFAFIELSWMTVYASGGTWLAQFLTTPRNIRRFNRGSGTAFILAGLGLGIFGKSR
jgi:threonine/homoserine/homoserine lactone efflux protein